MPFYLQSCCDACNFFLIYFPLEIACCFPPCLIQGNTYLGPDSSLGETRKQSWRDRNFIQTLKRNSKSLVPSLFCSTSPGSAGLCAGSAAGSIRMNHDLQFNRFLSHTSPLCPVASHKHLLSLQRNLWSFCREYVAFISLRITAMALMLLSGAGNASGIRPQVSSDNGTQMLKRNEKPKLCKSTRNSQFPFL